jgi:hypothetical protein
VIVTDDYVYKLKKPVDLGFLDFSTLDKRQHYCREEIRLNQRLSPQLYVDVMAIYGTADAPSFEPQGPELDYLVRMHPFDQSSQLDRLLERGDLTTGHMLKLADYIANFHQSAASAPRDSGYGEPDMVMRPVSENFIQIRQYIHDKQILERLSSLQTWSENEFEGCRELLQRRCENGFIRECHGDLHLRNLAWMDDQPLAFDCIEFEPNLYWIDTINDIAFLVMDLLYRQQQQLAWVVLNQYLSASGDFQGLALLRFYLVYRSLVRAKIAAITAAQAGDNAPDRQSAIDDLRWHLDLAESLSKAGQVGIYLMHGPSASGKSTLARQLAAPMQALILRSDVERKRLYGLQAEADASDAIGAGIYTEEATTATYQRLLQLSQTIIDAGYSVIVDATFNQVGQRVLFQRMAQQRQCAYHIIDIKVSEPELEKRIRQRQYDVSDANIDVLRNQLAQWRPLIDSEQTYAVTLEGDQPWNSEVVLSMIRAAKSG